MYFTDAASLANQVAEVSSAAAADRIGKAMIELAQSRYLWRDIAEAYFNAIKDSVPKPALGRTR